jgi:hypothetical protein
VIVGREVGKAARRSLPPEDSRYKALTRSRPPQKNTKQGVEAQTLANVYLALENDLEILPVLNKIDLPAAEPERVREEIEQVR